MMTTEKKICIGMIRLLICLTIVVLIRIMVVPPFLVRPFVTTSTDSTFEPVAPCVSSNGGEGCHSVVVSSSITSNQDATTTKMEQQRRHLQANGTPPKIPQFVGNWQRLVDCPFSLGEAHGGVIGNKDLLVTGGFLNFTTVNRRTYLLDALASNLATNVKWRRVDDYPYALGITHAAEVFYQNKMYICGGYYGYPGPVQSDCFVFDGNRAPNSTVLPQYYRLPNLPEPRAGGGLTYDVVHDALIFVGGTRRNVTKLKDILDTNTTFILYLNNLTAGWTRNASPKPYSANHISFVSFNNTCSVPPGSTTQRHFFFGGQIGQNESMGCLDHVYEYILPNDTWVKRKSMPFGRGHTGTSSMAFGCGFLVAGGAINVGNTGRTLLSTDDVSYYNSYNDTWISIGKMYSKIKTPVCGITLVPAAPVNKYYMYCTTGYKNLTFRREIKLA